MPAMFRYESSPEGNYFAMRQALNRIPRRGLVPTALMLNGEEIPKKHYHRFSHYFYDSIRLDCALMQMCGHRDIVNIEPGQIVPNYWNLTKHFLDDEGGEGWLMIFPDKTGVVLDTFTLSVDAGQGFEVDINSLSRGFKGDMVTVSKIYTGQLIEARK